MRDCFRSPIQEIFEAASLLDRAAAAHLAGERLEADRLIRLADMPIVAEWTESILGANSAHVLVSPDREPSLPVATRVPVRMPSAQEKGMLHERDGFHCRFCGIPVMRSAVRDKLRRHYPTALRWGKRNSERHAAFFCMWVQYDHVLPHAKGGDNSLSNLVVTCSACNYGRGGYTLSEVGLNNPFERPPVRSAWDGLERLFEAGS